MMNSASALKKIFGTLTRPSWGHSPTFRFDWALGSMVWLLLCLQSATTGTAQTFPVLPNNDECHRTDKRFLVHTHNKSEWHTSDTSCESIH
mmetsp:Transcript_13382/g.27157  ORF Transcript_13382/g.27157 Transcript_13382/m.27157 type:complete len:91 (+) Transcript_13382:511-783(+)